MPALLPLTASHRFVAFGVQHWLIMAGCVVVGVLVCRWGRRLRGSATERTVCRGYALVLVAFTVPLQVLQVTPGEYHAGTSLPLQLCDLSWMLAAYALWTGSERAASVLFYWGLTLVPQAIITPSLGQSFPDPRFFMYWGMHLLTFWAALLLSAGLGRRPTWRGYRRALVWTAVWAVAVFVIDVATGTNFGYFMRKPTGESLLSVLGPWPAYLLVEAVLVVAAWAVLTRLFGSPWHSTFSRLRQWRRHAPREDPAAGVRRAPRSRQAAAAPRRPRPG